MRGKYKYSHYNVSRTVEQSACKLSPWAKQVCQQNLQKVLKSTLQNSERNRMQMRRDNTYTHTQKNRINKMK